jgi:2-oxoglutarate dehydrogenase E2 component (dihydrolipoamide succinyltransferase)
MSVEIKVPQLGESIVEATIGQWLKHEGDTVAEGEPVVELETEKVNMEVVAPGSGMLQSITKQEGDTVGIGETIALLGEGAAAPAPEPAQTAAPAEAAPVEAAPSAPREAVDVPLHSRAASPASMASTSRASKDPVPEGASRRMT